jgi:hypothetical protein
VSSFGGVQVFYVPEARLVQGITNAYPGVVTTTEPHGYLDGLLIRLVMPGNFGINVLNDEIFTITILNSTTFSLNVDTSNLDSFTSLLSKQAAQVIPVGEVAETLKMAVKNGLPSFT